MKYAKNIVLFTFGIFLFHFLRRCRLIIVATFTRIRLTWSFSSYHCIWWRRHHFVNILATNEIVWSFPDRNTRRRIVEKYSAIARPNDTPSNKLKYMFHVNNSSLLKRLLKAYQGVPGTGVLETGLDLS